MDEDLGVIHMTDHMTADQVYKRIRMDIGEKAALAAKVRQNVWPSGTPVDELLIAFM